jgi:hypothetical protein
MTALTLSSLCRSLGLSPRGRLVAEGAAPFIIPDGLIAEWRFDSGAGQTLVDRSGNGHHGQLGSTAGADVNDPAWTAQGLSFDGVNDYVLVPDFAAPSAYHLDLVVKPDPATPSNGRLFAAHCLTAGNALVQIYRDGTNNTLRYRDRDGAVYVGSVNVFNGAWHLIQVSHSSSQIVAHVDGNVDVALTAASALSGATGPIAFGCRISSGAPALFLKGAEAWAAWYSAAFDEGQRVQNEKFARYLMAGRGVTLP